jgi:putative nucleotidyltransferase with HDIG domain
MLLIAFLAVSCFVSMMLLTIVNRRFSCRRQHDGPTSDARAGTAGPLEIGIGKCYVGCCFQGRHRPKSLFPISGRSLMISEKDIESLFQAQLRRIRNPELRAGVVRTFLLACERGNWRSVDDLRGMPFTLLTDSLGLNFVEHTIAVTEGAVALGRAQAEAYAELPYAIDFDRLYAGGLLHDVGKLLEIEPDGRGGWRKTRAGKFARHPISGAILASECGLPPDIVNIIACHSKEGEGRPQVVESVFIHLADFATFDPLVMKQKGTLIEDR